MMSKRIVPEKVSAAAAQGNRSNGSNKSSASNESSGSRTVLLEPDEVESSASASVLNGAKAQTSGRKVRAVATVEPVRRFAAPAADEHGTNRQAELFYLQKQIQTQTQMIFILEDGSRVQGVVEWYDRQSIKVRGKSRVLIYKSAIKYLYKAGEMGSAPDA